MKRPSLKASAGLYKLLGVILLFVLGLEFLVWRLVDGGSLNLITNLIYWSSVILLAAGLTIAAGFAIRYFRSNQKAIAIQTEHASLKRRLDGMVRLNQVLIDAQDEKDLIEKALDIISNVAESISASFIPYDEWGQPLKTYAFGPQLSSGLQTWTTQLTSPAIRERCQQCNEFHSETGGNCPLLAAPFTDLVRIYCLPLIRNGRAAGVVNLYLPSHRVISPEMHEFLDMLLTEMTLAIEMTRLRNQELVTLRQLQLVNGQQEDLSTTLGSLIDGLRDVLDFRHSKAIFRQAEPRFAGIEISTNSDLWLDSAEATAILNHSANQGCLGSSALKIEQHADASAYMVLPFCLPEGTSIGAVLMSGGRMSALQPRQAALIDTVTTQAAMLVENERRRQETEYRTVMQERVRLAREIHDSLAQTLAYLKLTSAQMQSQLAQGDLVRLGINLQHSHEALAEAYLETRQAIDNLRFAPPQDMTSWLEQIFHNFESSSGIKVVASIPAGLPQISPEIQAQLVRIVQESLSNVRKHAEASTVWITVREREQEMLIDLADNGIGFSAEDVPDLSRHGLRGMRERAELIGADFQITSQPGRGTSIRIEVPITIQETPA